MNFKKITAALTAVLIIVLSFGGCSRESYALTIDGNNIDAGVYGYYLSIAQNDPIYKDEKDKSTVACSLCAEYVAGHKLIGEYGVSLNAEQKVAAASQVKGMWQKFSGFYQKYSVSKQTLSEIIEYNKLIDNLTLKIYGDGGEKSVGNDSVEKYFYSNYVAVKIISADFKDDSGETFGKEQVDEITEKFIDMRNLTKAGADMQSAAEKLLDVADYDDNIVVIRSDDSSYPESMFSKILTLSAGSVQVFRYEKGIYLIQKFDMSKDKASYFDLYKNECLISMKKEETKNEISAIAQSYKMIYNDKVMSKIEAEAK